MADSSFPLWRKDKPCQPPPSPNDGVSTWLSSVMLHSIRRGGGEGPCSQRTIVSLLCSSFSFLWSYLVTWSTIERVHRSFVLARYSAVAWSSRKLTSKKFFRVSGVGALLEGKPKLYLRECLGARSSSDVLPESVSCLRMERNFFKGILVFGTKITWRQHLLFVVVLGSAMLLKAKVFILRRYITPHDLHPYLYSQTV